MLLVHLFDDDMVRRMMAMLKGDIGKWVLRKTAIERIEDHRERIEKAFVLFWGNEGGDNEEVLQVIKFRQQISETRGERTSISIKPLVKLSLNLSLPLSRSPSPQSAPTPPPNPPSPYPESFLAKTMAKTEALVAILKRHDGDTLAILKKMASPQKILTFVKGCKRKHLFLDVGGG